LIIAASSAKDVQQVKIELRPVGAEPPVTELVESPWIHGSPQHYHKRDDCCQEQEPANERLWPLNRIVGVSHFSSPPFPAEIIRKNCSKVNGKNKKRQKSLVKKCGRRPPKRRRPAAPEVHPFAAPCVQECLQWQLYIII